MPPAVSAADVVSVAESLDVGVTDIRRYRVAAVGGLPERLVLGYGDLAHPLVDEAVARLAAAVREVRGDR